MPHANINNIRIYFEVCGSGPPLVLIPGYTCDLLVWQPIQDILSKKFQLILFDNRGSGRSDCPEASFTLEEMAKDTLALMKHLNLQRPHILGQSMGSAIAQIIAAQAPDQIGKVVLADPFLKINPVAAAALQCPIHLKEDGVSIERQMEAVMPWILSNIFMGDPQKREAFITMSKDHPYPMTLKGLKKQCEALLKFDSTKWHQRIKTPTLVLAGEEDVLCPAKEAELLAKGIASSQFHTFMRLGHVSFTEEPEEFCRVVVSFL